MLVGKSQTLELHPMDAGYAFLQNALSALHRSAQPSRNVMFIGTGIASQQAEPARQIFNAVRVLAFVRTKALLTAEVSITFSKLYRACRYRKNVMSRKINYIKIAGCLTAPGNDQFNWKFLFLLVEMI